MDTDKFIKNCKRLVGEYVSSNFEMIPWEKIKVVWQTKALQNNKALLVVLDSTTEVLELYFEVTFNGDKEEFYLDVYKKQDNRRYATEYFN